MLESQKDWGDPHELANDILVLFLVYRNFALIMNFRNTFMRYANIGFG